MLKIGDFSKLAHVTIKALRLYDEMDLLRPIWVDRYTGYRFYRLDQLPRLNRILALKDLGFSLEQIKELLSKDLPSERLRQLFDEQQATLQQKLLAEQTRLERVAERLQQIELEGRLPDYEVTIKPASELTVASMRTLLPHAGDLAGQSGLIRRIIGEWTSQNGLRPVGPWITIYHNPAYADHNLDVEMALPVDGRHLAHASKRSRFVGLRQLPAISNMASLLFPEGSPAQPAYAALFNWAERGGYKLLSPIREVCLDDNATREEEAPVETATPCSYTEIQVPIETPLERKQKLFFNPYRKDSEMEPKIVEFPEATIAGMRYFGKNQNQEISALWGEANKHLDELKHVNTDGAYGLCISGPDMSANGFEYVAGLKVDSVEDLPEGMVARTIPAGRYAVFTHVGGLEKLKDTYEYIYQTWFPQSGLQPRGDVDFEFYNDDFKDFAPDSRFYIYVLLK